MSTTSCTWWRGSRRRAAVQSSIRMSWSTVTSRRRTSSSPSNSRSSAPTTWAWSSRGTSTTTSPVSFSWKMIYCWHFFCNNLVIISASHSVTHNHTWELKLTCNGGCSSNIATTKSDVLCLLHFTGLWFQNNFLIISKKFHEKTFATLL